MHGRNKPKSKTSRKARARRHKKESLIVASINIDGMTHTKAKSLVDYARRHNLSALLIQETKTRDVNFFMGTGYNLVHTPPTNPRKPRSGGVAILIRDNIAFDQLKTLTSEGNACWVRIKAKSKAPLVLCSAYWRGAETVASFQGIVESVTHRIKRLGGGNFVLGADLNADASRHADKARHAHIMRCLKHCQAKRTIRLRHATG